MSWQRRSRPSMSSKSGVTSNGLFGDRDLTRTALTASHCPPNPAPTAVSHSTRIQSSRCQNTEGVTMSNLDNALRELREKRSHAQLEIDKLDQIISGIESLNGTGASGKTAQRKHTLSASARRRISLAQKARWASLRKKSQPMAVAKTISAVPKRKMSAAGRKRIAAASRARWAAFRAAKKNAA
jgi:hypothetical protein